MARIPAPLPGIRGLYAFRPATAPALQQLSDVLLKGPNSLTHGERELIVTYVSALNDCAFCRTRHGARAAAHLGGNGELVRRVTLDYANADISRKLKALLAIAGKVQQSGKQVSDADVAAARVQGATDLEIHDTVLIAAAFCMYNRYVDALDVSDPDNAA
ncbi:MAG TPA: peroxidase-related enzyme [Casimicrobiaceae bacterium]|jgi:uncharacterized peroxidase-related enzyme